MDLTGRKVLVVGGGRVASRKIGVLLRAGARVVCVAPHVSTAVARLAREGRIVWKKRRYRASDLAGAALVVTATDDPRLAARIARAARRRGIWVNAAENPGAGDVHFAAVRRVRRKGGPEITVAVSTGGCDPAVARKTADAIRKTLTG